MTLEQVNTLAQAAFVEELGGVFEHSPWVAERAWEARPFASLEGLHAAMTMAMESATREEQLALLCAHPDLGSSSPMSAASTEEQAGAFRSGEPPLPEELQRYRRKFGFPFIHAVKGSTAKDISFALWVRIEDRQEEEFQQALREVRSIAWFRLQRLFKES